MEKTHEIAIRTYNEQVSLGMCHTPMNWHIWKKAFRIAEIELSKLHQPTVISAVCENPHCEDGYTMGLYGEKYCCHVCRHKQNGL